MPNTDDPVALEFRRASLERRASVRNNAIWLLENDGGALTPEQREQCKRWLAEYEYIEGFDPDTALQ